MTDHERILIAQFGLVMVLAWFVYAYVYKRTRQDAFRERLFSIRDDLFDYMWKNGLPYDLPAYGRLRRALNSVIRNVDAGDYNLLTIWLRARAIHSQQAMPTNKVAEAINAIEAPEVRKHFTAVYTEFGLRGFAHLVFEGPLSLALAPPFFAQLNGWHRQSQPLPEDNADPAKPVVRPEQEAALAKRVIHRASDPTAQQLVETVAEIERQKRECEAEEPTLQPV
jgi:hypothetical protein